MNTKTLLTAAILSMLAGSAMAFNDQAQGQQQGQLQGQVATGGSAHSGSLSGAASQSDNSNPQSVSIDGDKTDNLGIVISAPAFSYAPGSSANEFGMTTSWTVQFPVIGGAYGESEVVPTAAGIVDLAKLAHKAKVTPDVSEALGLTAGLCEYYSGFAARAKLNCGD